MCSSRFETGELIQRDVKNEDRSGYVYENKGDDDNMSYEKHGHFTKMHQLHGNQHQSLGLSGGKCTDCG